MTLADFPAMQALPIDGDELEVSEAEKHELDARWEGFERNPSRALTLEQFDSLMKAKRG